MKKLYTLAYPTLSEEASRFIEDLRNQYDDHHELVRAHFTLAFGCAEIDESIYVADIRQIADAIRPIRFVCRYAMLGVDEHAERFYAYLVPDEGHSGLSRLHDAIYCGVLAPHLRLDIPYIPHITVDSSSDRRLMKSLCNDINTTGLEVQGFVSTLTISAIEGNTLLNLATVPLD